MFNGYSQLNKDSIKTIIDTTSNLKKQLVTLLSICKNNSLTNTELEFIKDEVSICVNKENTTSSKALGLYYLGYIYYSQKKLNQSIEYYFKSLELAELNKDFTLIGDIHNRLAYSFNDSKNIPYAKKHFSHALESYYTVHKTEDISEVFNMLGTIYKNEERLDSALFYHKKALDIRIKLNNKKLLASTYNNIGLVYKKKKDYQLALDYLKLALQMRKDINDKKGIAGASINIGNVLIAQNKFKEAMEYSSIGTAMAYKIKAGDFYKNGVNSMANCYYGLNDFKMAADYREREKVINDSLANEQVNKQISELAAQYESNRKDAELQLQQEKIKNRDTELKRQKLFTVSATVVLLLVVLLIFFIYRGYRINKQNAKDLAKQNTIIEQKNKEITDSINYAKRIQYSILPSENAMQKYLNEFFILYQPKDIVSGDFFWFHPLNNSNTCLIAAADCTGHGVPGAFMSLIGKEKLDKAAVISSSPSEILKELNIAVKYSLQQDSDFTSQDGMDIALIKLERNNDVATLTYAGANRPLWIIRSGSSAIEDIKATKHAIAGFTSDTQLFAEHQINLAKGDTIYLFTDGYSDQFGGEKSKKLTSGAFRKLILANCKSNLTEQRNTLQSFMQKWMFNQEQVDDILVIGIRI